MPAFSRPALSVVLLSLLAWCAVPASAIVITGFATTTNDRFANDGSFIGSEFDFSGVGLTSGGKWGTLLSNNVFISSNHSHPGIGDSLTFYSSNDPAGASTSATVASGQRIGSSDLWVGVLSSPVSGSYTTYQILSDDIADSAAFNSSGLSGVTAMMVGKSPTSWSSTLDMAMGLNVLDVWAEDSTAGGSTDDALAALYDYDPTDVSFESLLQGGDSGAPLFISINYTLVVTGINWWVGEATVSETTYDLSGFGYVGNYDTQIAAIVSANAVPEPATVALIAGIAVGWMAGRKRRRLPLC